MVVKQDFKKKLSIQIHQASEVGHLVITHCNGSQEKWQALHWLLKVECHHEKWPLPNIIHGWDVDNAMGHEVFFYKFLGYHQI